MKLRSLCVFCGSSVGADARFTDAAREMGLYLAQSNITFVYGGGRIGLMGIIADTVLQNGGKVIGVIPKFLSTLEIRHDGLTECYEVDDMHTRKQMMYQLSDAFVAMPGGFGTLDELFEIITWHQLSLHNKPVAIFNVEGYYNSLIQMVETMRSQKFISDDFSRYLKHANSLIDVFSALEPGLTTDN